MVNPDRGMLSNAKKKWAIKPWKSWRKPQSVLLSEKANLKISQTVWFQVYALLEKASYGGSKRVRGFEGLRERKGWVRGTNKSSWHCSGGCLSLSKPIEGSTPRGNPNVHYGLWVAIMQPCRFINRIKYCALAEGVDCGGGCVWRSTETGGTWPLCFLLHFASNIKMLWKLSLSLKGDVLLWKSLSGSSERWFSTLKTELRN